MDGDGDGAEREIVDVGEVWQQLYLGSQGCQENQCHTVAKMAPSAFGWKLSCSRSNDRGPSLETGELRGLPSGSET